MIFNLDEAVARCFGKYPMFQEMVGCFYDEADELLAQMHTAVSQSDAAELGRLGHRLKGTIVYLGAQPAADAARRVEQIGKSGDLAGAAEAIDALERQLESLKDALSPHRAEPEGSKLQRG